MTDPVTELLTRTPCPTFFEPTDTWWKFCERPWVKWRQIWDVGAGNGSLTRAMADRGYLTNGLDLLSRPNQDVLVQVQDATELWYDDQDLLVVARPCHGADLMQRLAARTNPGTDLIYVGLEKNLDRDLDGLKRERLIDGVGKEGEVAWRVLPPDEDEHPLFLIKTRHWNRPGYVRREGDRWVNENGGWFDVRDDHEIVDAEPFVNHPYVQVREEPEGYCEPDTDVGWIAPDGLFYGVGYAEHDAASYPLFGCPVRWLEKRGFVRAHGGRGRDEKLWVMGRALRDERRRPTPAQVRTLRRLGYDPKDEADDGPGYS